MHSKRLIKIVFILMIILAIGISAKYAAIIHEYKNIRFEQGFSNWSRTMPPLHTSVETIEFIVEEGHIPILKMWWEGMTGNVEVTLLDSKNQSLFYTKSTKEMHEKSLPINEGSYKLKIRQNQFTGALALGFDNLIIKTPLNEENFKCVQSSPESGFCWNYLLYIPDQIKHAKLLVVPNNTGYVTDNYDIHMEQAKNLIKYKSTLAQELGVPMLVPVFPRPESYSEIYTHALDRASLLTDIDTLERLDIQLIKMIDDCKHILSEDHIDVDDKILLSGFSASGDFADRFSFLHPDLVEAVACGGSDTIVPLKSLRGTELPYPLGVADYYDMTGNKFDLDAVSNMYRFIYKGAQDQGGWQTTDENVRYTWKDYYEKYLRKDLEKRKMENMNIPNTNSESSKIDIDLIAYKAFEGRILLDRFYEVQSIYNDLNLINTTFKVYENTEHTITDQIKVDEGTFFKRILESQ